MYGHTIYTVDGHFPSEVIDLLSDLEILVSSLTRETSSPVESDVGDMILNMVDVPLLEEEESGGENTDVEL